MSASPRERQKRTLVALAILLIVGGAAVLFLLHRMPLPLRILIGLGFNTKTIHKATKDMSGGWRMRVALARALFIWVAT